MQSEGRNISDKDKDVGHLKSRKRRQLIAALGLVTTSGPLLTAEARLDSKSRQVSGTSNWNSHGYDADGSRSTSQITPPDISETVWEFGELPCSPPVVADGTVYFGTEAGVVNAVNSVSGAEEWSRNLSNDPFHASPLVAGGSLYMLTTEGTLYALNGENGSTEWSTNVDGSNPTHPVRYRSNMYLSTSDVVTSINLSDGDVNWKYATSSRSGMTPVVDGQGVYFCDSGYVYGIRRWDGSEVWGTYIGGSLSSIVADEDQVYAASGSIGAYSKRSGHEMWSLGLRGEVVGRPALHNGSLYVATEDGTLESFEASGNKEWTVDLGREGLGSPVVVGDTVYSVFSEGFDSDSTVLKAVNASNGEELSHHEFGGLANSGPVVTDGNLYVGTDAGAYSLGENKPTPPSPSFEINPTNPSSGQVVTVSASPTSPGDFPIQRYEWSFETPNGTETATGENLERDLSGGNWQIELRVTDINGITNTTTKSIQVSEDSEDQDSNKDETDSQDTTDQNASGDIRDSEPESDVSNDSMSPTVLTAAAVGLGGILVAFKKYREKYSGDENPFEKYR